MASNVKVKATQDPLDEGTAEVEARGLSTGSNAVVSGPAVDVREQSYELLAIAFGPLIWVVHFLASYLTNAIYCAKFAGDSGDASAVRLAIFLFTVVALPLVGVLGWISYRKHRYQDADLPHDADSPEDRFRFLGFAGFLLSLLSFVAIIFTALAAVFIGTCD